MEDRARICVVGSLNADIVVRSPRLPAPGETVLGGPLAVYPGGKGANQAVAAARMGVAVSMVGAVGDDEHGRIVRAALEAEGIDLSGLSTRAGVATGVGVVTVAEGGENSIVVAPGANHTVTPADLERSRAAISAADVLLLQLEIPLETVARAARLARNAGTTVLLNAAPGGPLPADLLADVDVLLVNEVEAEALGGSAAPGPGTTPRTGGGVPSSPEDLLKAISRTGIGTLIVTAGERGAWYLSGQEIGGRVEAFGVEAVDSVGAGDAFAGVLAARWAEHQAASRAGVDPMGLLDALTWASAAGALAATRVGAIPSLPRRAEVVALLKRPLEGVPPRG